MRIHSIQRYRKNGKAGVSARITFKDGKVHTMYFEVEEKFHDVIAKDASPFLAAMLPIAMLRKENIEVDGEVSKRFQDNLPEIIKTVDEWNLGLSPISVQVKESRKDHKKSKHVGCFFSGGADSFYTYLKNKKSIDSFIFVHGFDISVHNNVLYATVEKNIAKIAATQNVRFIKVKTNLRETYDQYIDWNLAHGFAVGSVALFVRDGFQSIYVSCGLGAKNKQHYSMTPDLDPLYRGEQAEVVHFGCNADKLQKLKELSQSPLAMQNLRVCWVNRSNAYNCSSCEKCMRNMLGLYLCDSLEKSQTFAHSIDVERLRNIRVDLLQLKYFRPILEAFDKKGDTSEVREALAELIEKSSSPSVGQKISKGLRDRIRAIDRKYNQNRFYWYMANKGIV